MNIKAVTAIRLLRLPAPLTLHLLEIDEPAHP